MVNIGYRTARIQAQVTRSFYARLIPQIVQKPISQTCTIQAVVYSLSYERDLPEQVVSLRSFLNYVGIPQKFVIVSDGYSPQSCHFLKQIHPCVEIIPLKEFMGHQLPSAVYDYAQTQSMGRKLATLLSIPQTTVSIYTDSDIVFFPSANSLVSLIDSPDSHSYYLPDVDPAFDFRIIQDSMEAQSPVNGGFILFKNPPDWSWAMERFLSFKESPNYFTEQTLVHLTMHKNNAKPLPKNQYIMGREDEFVFTDQYAKQPDIVLRHYVTPVRYKMWCNLNIFT